MRKYLSDTQFDHLIDELEKIKKAGDNAIEEESQEKAAKQWQKIFGSRFPVYEDDEDKNGSKSKKFGSPAIVGSTVKSA